MDLSDRLDGDGYILPEADLAHVPPEYAGVPEVAGDLLAGVFGATLHSAYMYGSITRGNAVPGQSDADLVAVLRAGADEEDLSRARQVERSLQERFPVLSSAGVVVGDVGTVLSQDERYGWQVFLRELSVCIRGQDLRPGLPRTRPCAEVAAGFHGDTPAVLMRAREVLSTSTDPEVIRRACRGASRRMVQAAFAIVMARDGVWATVLEDQAAAVGAAFPDWASAARLATEQGRRPVADAAIVGDLLETFGRWAEETLDRECRARLRKA
jgi:uncharacterized protein